MQLVALGTAGDNPSQDVGEIGEWFNAVELTGLNQRIGNGPVSSSGIRTRDVPPGPAELPLPGPNCAALLVRQPHGARLVIANIDIANAAAAPRMEAPDTLASTPRPR